MRFLTALGLGAVLGFTLPQFLGGRDGIWMNSWADWGTVQPLAGSPGLLFSIPVFLAATAAFLWFFSWHD